MWFPKLCIWVSIILLGLKAGGYIALTWGEVLVPLAIGVIARIGMEE